MCLSKAYFERGDDRELVMDEIASVSVEDGKLLLKSLFGEEKKVEAAIRRIDFVASSLLLESRK